jgi:hypothetical protein
MDSMEVADANASGQEETMQAGSADANEIGRFKCRNTAMHALVEDDDHAEQHNGGNIYCGDHENPKHSAMASETESRAVFTHIYV